LETFWEKFDLFDEPMRMRTDSREEEVYDNQTLQEQKEEKCTEDIFEKALSMTKLKEF
jgi:hypothetical protein